jgi:HAD superfamily hydrolase (TIGR01509 family)
MELVIFDCDGVLIDSEIISCRCAAELLRDAGIAVSTDDIVARFVGMPRRDMLRTLSGETGVRLPGDLEARLGETIVRRFETELRAIDGVGPAIAALDRPVCVASGSDVPYIRRALALTGLAGLFRDDRLFSASMVKRGKPAPDVFLHAADRLGVAPAACVVIEDSVAGVQGAVAAGMTVLGFTGGLHHANGDAAAGLARAGARHTFARMAALPGLLASL